MAFKDDNGGFAFQCDDAKFSICASTWNTRLSQIGKISGAICIITNRLPNVEYISRILSKRPRDIFIIAHNDARPEAMELKQRFPDVRIALHANINAKAVFVAPETVWLSSADFGETKMIESAAGFHSATLYNRSIESLFNREWQNAQEL